MRVTATFSDGLVRQLDGRAIGDEFTVTATARIVGAEEVLLDVTSHGALDPEVMQGGLDVHLLLSHGKVQEAANGEAAQATRGTGSS